MNWFWSALFGGLGATVLITVLTFGIALIAAIPVTMIRQSRFAILRGIGTTYVELFRGIPPLTLIFLAYFALPRLGVTLDPLMSAVTGLTLMATAYVAEIYRGALRAVPPGQLEGAQAIGLTRFHTYLRVISPQALLTAIPVLISYFIGLFKESTLASTIGVMDVTGKALVVARNELAGLDVFVQAAIIYLLISIPIGLFGRWLTKKLSLPKLMKSHRFFSKQVAK